MTTPLKLYFKPWCPWCIKAKAWLDERGYVYEDYDVEADPAFAEEMFQLSGQRLVPTLAVGGLVLPDFGPEELEAFMAKHGIQP